MTEVENSPPGQAPIIPVPGQRDNYPYSHPRIRDAWNAAWLAMTVSGDKVDGPALAKQLADTYGLSPATIQGVLARAAKAGLLEQEFRAVPSGRGPRKRSFYGIRK